LRSRRSAVSSHDRTSLIAKSVIVRSPATEPLRAAPTDQPGCNGRGGLRLSALLFRGCA
jgi:hypothetical protein